jgi:hypothetical protein
MPSKFSTGKSGARDKTMPKKDTSGSSKPAHKNAHATVAGTKKKGSNAQSASPARSHMSGDMKMDHAKVKGVDNTSKKTSAKR